jgi:hypothetical protein
MSHEAEFRRAWARALAPHTQLLEYMSTMAKAGVPDVHTLVDDDGGRAIWCELKAFDHWPKSPEANVLEHRFTGPQRAFMRRVDRAGGRGLGVVGWKEAGRWQCVVLRAHCLGAEGTVSRAEIERHRPLVIDALFASHWATLVRRL